MDHQFGNLFMNNDNEHDVSNDNDNNAGQFSDLPGFGPNEIDGSSHHAAVAAEPMPALPMMGSYNMNVSSNFNAFAHDQPQQSDKNHSAKDSNSNAATSFDRSKMVPPSKVGIKFYSKNDVLCGRGGGTNVHPGNRRFRDLINANRRAYLKSKKNDKPAISRSIVQTIRDMNGRFLKKDEKLNLWFEVGDDGAREKTSQALRQRAPEMKKILFEEEQRQRREQVARQQVSVMQKQRGYMNMNSSGMSSNMNRNSMANHQHSAQMMNSMSNNFNQPSMNNFANSQPSMNNNFNFSRNTPMMSHYTNNDNLSSNMDSINSSNNNNQGPSIYEQYAMIQQQKYFASRQDEFLEKLKKMNSMNGGNMGIPSEFQNQQRDIESLTSQTLLSQGLKPVVPRGA
jgi:hypothetical protein